MNNPFSSFLSPPSVIFFINLFLTPVDFKKELSSINCSFSNIFPRYLSLHFRKIVLKYRSFAFCFIDFNYPYKPLNSFSNYLFSVFLPKKICFKFKLLPFCIFRVCLFFCINLFISSIFLVALSLFFLAYNYALCFCSLL